jgi:hypothetical protein
MYFRGRLVEVDGFMERADRSVGIMSDYFISDKITDVETGIEWTQEQFDALTDGEQLEIDNAFWDSLPFDDYQHTVYSWTENEELYRNAFADGLI